VPATSANLGPGFDACGLALAWYDEVHAEVAPATSVVVEGEGAGEVPLDDGHLIAATVLAVAAESGIELPGVRLRCRNTIPHGRGLGSSAAAIVAGVLLGRALAGLPRDQQSELRRAAAAEGHPDNVAPALLGGYTVAWSDGDAAASRAVALPPHPAVQPVLFVAQARLATERARGLLPSQVAFTDAAFGVGRAALLTAAVTAAPQLLLPATADRLHQQARRTGYPDSVDLVERLRGSGIAAAISGAGPTVIALAVGAEQAVAAAAVAADGFAVVPMAVDGQGATLTVTES
jgi:homoserine kinase